MRLSEPCLCGDPLCWRCFPAQHPDPEEEETLMRTPPRTPRRITITRLGPQWYQVTWICPCGRWAEERHHTDATAQALKAEIRTTTTCAGCRSEARAYSPQEETSHADRDH